MKLGKIAYRAVFRYWIGLFVNWRGVVASVKDFGYFNDYVKCYS